MRKFKQSFDGREVDLDNPKTYKHLPKGVSELDDLMILKIGQALLYMDYFPRRKGMFPAKKLKPKMVRICDMSPDWRSKRKIDINNSGWHQRQRVIKLIKVFANNRHNKWGDVQWFREQVFLFDDETENMC